MSIHNLCFEKKFEKNSEFLYENFPFLVVKFSIYFFNIFEYRVCVFVMSLLCSSEGALDP